MKPIVTSFAVAGLFALGAAAYAAPATSVAGAGAADPCAALRGADLGEHAAYAACRLRHLRGAPAGASTSAQGPASKGRPAAKDDVCVRSQGPIGEPGEKAARAGCAIIHEILGN